MKSTKEVFGNKVRLRICGLCFKNDAILLVKHNIDGDILWAPPGGGIKFGESLENCLIREFEEETSLTIVPGNFLFITEYNNPPLHAIEMFYEVKNFSGNLILGSDPKIDDSTILQDIGFFDQEGLSQLPLEQLHSCLKICNNPIELLDKRGHL